jgi:hypothetical protein
VFASLFSNFLIFFLILIISLATPTNAWVYLMYWDISAAQRSAITAATVGTGSDPGDVNFSIRQLCVNDENENSNIRLTYQKNVFYPHSLFFLINIVHLKKV